MSSKTNQLFDLNDKIILYDLTNSYFEGRMSGSNKAKFGRSKEKRTDAKIISLALVTNIYGFIKYSKIYKGNMADCKTLETTIKELNEKVNKIYWTLKNTPDKKSENGIYFIRTNNMEYL